MKVSWTGNIRTDVESRDRRSNHHRNVGTVSSPPQIGSMEKKSDGYSSKLERGLSLNMTVTLRQGLLCTRTPVLLSSGVMQTKINRLLSVQRSETVDTICRIQGGTRFFDIQQRGIWSTRMVDTLLHVLRYVYASRVAQREDRRIRR
jgi:hypothetical protein